MIYPIKLAWVTSCLGVVFSGNLKALDLPKPLLSPLLAISSSSVSEDSPQEPISDRLYSLRETKKEEKVSGINQGHYLGSSVFVVANRLWSNEEGRLNSNQEVSFASQASRDFSHKRKRVVLQKQDEGFLCLGNTEGVEKWSELPQVPENLSGAEEKEEFSNSHLRARLAGVFQDLFQWSRSTEEKANKTLDIEVIATDHKDRNLQDTITSTLALKSQKQGFWNGFQPVSFQPPSPLPPLRTNNNNNEEDFKVIVNGQRVINVSDRKASKAIASRFNQLLSRKDFQPEEIQARLISGKPVVVSGERVILRINESMALATEENQELLAIEVANQLRKAFEVPPLTLTEAQTIMYQLLPTQRSFEGLASWYGPYFHGRLTANGEIYNQEAFTAAHKSLPFNTYLKITNLDNQESVIIRINDRGPYIPPRTLDLSKGVARCLKGEETGVIPYKAEFMEPYSEL